MKNFEQVNGLKNLFSFSELRFLGMHKKGKLSNRLFQEIVFFLALNLLSWLGEIRREVQKAFSFDRTSFLRKNRVVYLFHV